MERKNTGSWLDNLQQESWQLELLISGFAIFLLIGGWEPFGDLLADAYRLTEQSMGYFIFFLTLGMLRVAYLALLVSLILHVVLRGVWIAAVGLRYVSGDIDYDRLRYQARYRRWLSGSIGSFDDYIERLERYCSILFSVAFLIIFCLISLTTYFMAIVVFQLAIDYLTDYEGDRVGVFAENGVLNIIWVVLGLIYLIDFFTLGFFKRNRYTARVYYPIYRFMGWITLAALYRPLYHNLIDERLGRRLARLLPLIIIGILLLISTRFVTGDYFPYYYKDGLSWIDHQSYDSYTPDLQGQSWRTTLSTKYVQDNYVEAFVPYRPRLFNPVIEREYAGLAVSRYAGLRFDEPMKFSELYNQAANYDSLLVAFTELHRLYVDDSLRTDVAPRFHFHPGREENGLLYMVPAHELDRGEHRLRIEQRHLRGDSLYWRSYGDIYFYK